MKGTRQWNELRQQIAEAQGFRCWYCGASVTATKNAPRSERAEIDHQYPKEFGGGNERENLVVSCQRCNAQKGTRSVEEYRRYLTLSDPHARLALAIMDFGETVRSLPSSGDRFLDWLKDRVPAVTFFGERGHDGP